MATIIKLSVEIITPSEGVHSARTEVIDTQYYVSLDDFHDGVEQLRDLGEYFKLDD